MGRKDDWQRRARLGVLGGLLLHGPPLLLPQVLFPQPRLLLKLLERLLPHLVGRGPHLPLSTVGRGPLPPLFMLGGEYLLLLVMVGEEPSCRCSW